MGKIILIGLLFLLSSAFLPSFIIKPVLDRLRNKNKNLKEYSDKHEREELREYPMKLGEIERLLFGVILLASSYSSLMTFFVVWLGLKTATNYKLWVGVDTTDGHFGRALFCVYLIGNCLSILSVILFYFLFFQLQNYLCPNIPTNVFIPLLKR